MITIGKGKVCITILDASPEERITVLTKALAASMRWYALNTDKRSCDHDHAAELATFMQLLLDVKAPV
jgi:hypothetical protein